MHPTQNEEKAQEYPERHDDEEVEELDSEEETMILSGLHYSSYIPDLLICETNPHQSNISQSLLPGITIRKTDESLSVNIPRKSEIGLVDEVLQKQARGPNDAVDHVAEGVDHPSITTTSLVPPRTISSVEKNPRTQLNLSISSDDSAIPVETLLKTLTTPRESKDEDGSSKKRMSNEWKQEISESGDEGDSEFMQITRYYSASPDEQQWKSHPSRPKQCHLCGKQGHLKADCPQNICYNCQGTGHISRDCQEPKKYRIREEGVCRRCGRSGHMTSCCPTEWRKYLVSTDSPDPHDLSEKCPIRRFCYNCGAFGHFGDACLEIRIDHSFRPVQTAFHDYCEEDDLHIFVEDRSNETRRTEEKSSRRTNNIPKSHGKFPKIRQNCDSILKDRYDRSGSDRFKRTREMQYSSQYSVRKKTKRKSPSPDKSSHRYVPLYRGGYQ